MALTDMTLEEARRYVPDRPEPTGFRAFWERTLDEHDGIDLDPRITCYDNRQRLVDTYDVDFAGYAGMRVSAWLHVPAGASGGLPLVVQYQGYSSSRGVPLATPFVGAGYAHLVVDPRGQGWAHPNIVENSPDAGPWGGSGAPGFMTPNLSNPDDHYFRRLYVDAFRALQVGLGLDLVDPGRVVVQGHSQGGAQAIAVSGLAAMRGVGLTASFVDAPFLCDIRRALDVATGGPYLEVVAYLRSHPHLVGRALGTLGLFDNLHLARYAADPAYFSVAMMDPVCPPSGCWAAYNLWGELSPRGRQGTPKQMAVYPFAQHSAGEDVQTWNQLGVMERLLTR